MKFTHVAVFGAISSLLLGSVFAGDAPPPQAARWSPERASQWYAERPWIVGCNFLPSTAVNDVEMWQESTFDPETIDRELGWAESLGFNTVRVFINYVVWEAEADGLKQRINRFLEIADRHGISTMFILFDDCFKPEPKMGKQEEPIPGVHNSQWVCSPGDSRVNNRESWGKLEAYVKDIVKTFAKDRRVVMWDLYNEAFRSVELVDATFRWAREATPDQPLTSCLFGSDEMKKRIVELSDVISFHNYGGVPGLEREIAELRKHGRPLVCSEWMARVIGSRIETHLPVFKREKVGCCCWGLVAGRTQTYYIWGSNPPVPDPVPWLHDILRRDGSPFSPLDVRILKHVNRNSPGELKCIEDVVPTARKQAVTWRYTLDDPGGNWFASEFDDSKWKQGAAPFGCEEPKHDRHPRTVWNTSHIWLRRSFDAPFDKDTLVVSMQHDDEAELYINGVLAAKAIGYNAAYEHFDLSLAALKSLKSSGNVLALKCSQDKGGQYIDAGFDSMVVSTGNATSDRPTGPADAKSDQKRE